MKQVFRYLASQSFALMGLVFIGLLCVTWVLDSVELTRRLARHSQGDISLALVMAAYKLPDVGFQLLTFAVLIGAVWLLWRMSQNRELIILRASGLSVWQFLTPIMTVALCLGIARPVALNPLGSIFLRQFQVIEGRYLGAGEENARINVTQTGLWLRQPHQDGYAILNAARVDAMALRFREITLLVFNDDNVLLRRIDAPEMRFEDGAWVFPSANILTPDGGMIPLSYYQLPAWITPHDLLSSSLQAESVSFWQLPERIRIMNEAGFPTAALRMHYFSLLADPLLFLGLVLVASVISMPRSRRQAAWKLPVLTIAAALCIFFIGDVLKAFGISDLLPIPLAAFAPAALTTIAGIAGLLYTEDG